ncbi:MAG: hypothetical protein WC110_03845 [Bacteroidales bacterium]|jgi:hypothetical protein|nr:hypothetical protein [Bacteroidales bacterium]MDD4257134.1 hypothetical protein [Bacteroidales bacterium]
MKKRNGLLLTLAVIASLAIGFLIGIMVDIPKTDNTQVAGTIGKIQNYKNVKITEQDIQLKNELMADSVLLKAIGNYFNYYYVSAVSQGDRIKYALKELDPEQEFKAFSGMTLTEFAGYGTFLENARKDLMLAIALCKFPNDVHPVLLRNAITQANNVIAQMNYRKQAVLNLIDNLDTFIGQKSKDVPVVLANVHAVLSCDQIINAVALNDKVVLKYFDRKKLYTTEIKASSLADMQGSSSVLQGYIIHDAAILKDQMIGSSSSLGIDPIQLDQENLGFLIEDAALIGTQFLLDAGNLQGFIGSASELGYFVVGSVFQNLENLGIIYTHQDAAGNLSLISVVEDSQSLGTVAFMDAQSLGLLVFDNAETLGLCSISQLGSFMNSTAQIGSAHQ